MRLNKITKSLFLSSCQVRDDDIIFQVSVVIVRSVLNAGPFLNDPHVSIYAIWRSRDVNIFIPRAGGGHTVA